VATGKERRCWKPFADEQRSAALSNTKGFANAVFSPEGRFLAVRVGWWGANNQWYSLDSDSELIVFEVGNAKPRWQPNLAKQTLGLLAFSPDGKSFAVDFGDKNMHLYECSTGKERAVAPLKFALEAIWGLAFSPDGATVALAGLSSEEIALWNTQGKPQFRVFTSLPTTTYKRGLPCLTFSPDGKTLLMGVGPQLHLYDVATGSTKLALPGHRGPVNHVAFFADGQRLQTGAAKSPYQVLTWDLHTWKQLRRQPMSNGDYSNVRTPAPLHAVYVARDGDKGVGVFALGSKQPLAHLEGLSSFDDFYENFFSPSGRLFIASNRIGQCVFAVPSGKLLSRLPFKLWECAWAFSADDRLVALYDIDDGLIHVYTIGTGKLLWRMGQKPKRWSPRTLGLHTRSALAISADGKWLASWDGDRDIQIWDLTTGKEYRRLTGQAPVKYNAPSACLAWSPDGRMLAVGGMGGEHKIQLWEISTAKVRRELRGHGDAVSCVAFSPDGKWLASGSADSTVLIWEVAASRVALTTPDLERHPADLDTAGREKAFQAVPCLPHLSSVFL
jgi:WD40 repeat protein